ncbi:MAG: HAD family hydrolase [Vallitaleaceae bacterium]|nr:HAD family hydrolase [Vallitaleaceae bacterium]
MINTILLDLDGTVLPMDMDLFMKIYFSEMSKAFSDLVEPEALVSNVWAATKAMVKNTDVNKVNEEVFMETYGKLISGSLDEHKERFEDFYDAGYLKTQASVLENGWIRKSIDLLKAKGYQLVLATNPIFPLKAILYRIKWAGFEPEEFSYISSFEQNHFCKPQIQYFQEVLEAIQKQPEECIMVGNDVQEDMIVRQLGVKTFLIDENLLHRTSEPIETDYQGDYKAFYHFVEGLPEIK